MLDAASAAMAEGTSSATSSHSSVELELAVGMLASFFGEVVVLLPPDPTIPAIPWRKVPIMVSMVFGPRFFDEGDDANKNE